MSGLDETGTLGEGNIPASEEPLLQEHDMSEPSLEKSSKGINAEIIYNLLYQRYKKNDGEYVVAGEVWNSMWTKARRYDFVAVHCWSPTTIEVVEIKISQADLRHEVQQPEKHNVIFDKIDYYTLAAPDDVILAQRDIIPKNWGLLAVKKDKDGKWYIKKMRSPMPLHDDKRTTIDRQFAFSLIRALDQQSALRHTLQKQLTAEYERGKKDAEERLTRESSYYVKVDRRAYEARENAYYFLRDLGVYNMDEYEKKRFLKELKIGKLLGGAVDSLLSNIEYSISRMTEFKEKINKAIKEGDRDEGKENEDKLPTVEHAEV